MSTMKKLGILLRVGLRGLLRRRAEKNGLRGKLGTAGYAVLMLLAWGALAGYTVALGVGLNAIGMLTLYPTLVLTVDALMTMVMAIARAPGTLFRARDFDLVMSLPVPGWTVAAARLIELYAFELLYSAAVLLPAGATYAVLARPGALYYPMYLAALLLAPMLPVLLGALLGALIHTVASLFRSSRAVSLILTFVFMIGVMTCSYSFGFVFGHFTPAQFIDLAGTVSGVFSRVYPPAALFGRAVTGPDGAAFAAFAGISLGAFALLAAALGRWFVALNTRITARHTRGDFRLRRLEAHSAPRALLRREVRRYFASNLYVTNTGFGLVLSLLGVVALIIFGIERLAALMELTGFEAQMRMAVPFLVAFMTATCCTTSASISMEGKQLWQALSLPVRGQDFLLAKVKLNLLVSLPFALLDGALLCAAFRLTPLAAALALLLPAATAVFSALFGLLCNLKWHRFDWTNEVTVVKQSLPVGIAMLAAMALCLVPLGLMIFVPALGHGLVPLVTLLAVALADAGMYALIRRNAEKWVAGLRRA